MLAEGEGLAAVARARRRGTAAREAPRPVAPSHRPQLLMQHSAQVPAGHAGTGPVALVTGKHYWHGAGAVEL